MSMATIHQAPSQHGVQLSTRTINLIALGAGLVGGCLMLIVISLLIREPAVQPAEMTVQTHNTSTESLPEFIPEKIPEPPAEVSPPMPQLDLAALPALDANLKLPDVRMDQPQWEPDIAAPPAPPRPQQLTESNAAAPVDLSAPSGPALTDNRKAINLTNPAFLKKFYPRRAERRRITGTSVVKITINTDGKVTAAEVIRSEPVGIFERAAQRAALEMRYQPAVQNGKPIATTQQVTLTWSLQ